MVKQKKVLKEKKMPKEEEEIKEKRDDISAIFVPSGALIGLGIGFLYDNVAAGVLIGLGVGFAIMAVLKLIKSR
jgi:hypothetical protein